MAKSLTPDPNYTFYMNSVNVALNIWADARKTLITALKSDDSTEEEIEYYLADLTRVRTAIARLYIPPRGEALMSALLDAIDGQIQSFHAHWEDDESVNLDELSRGIREDYQRLHYEIGRLEDVAYDIPE